MAASYKFLSKVPSKTEIQCKKLAKYFPFNFGWYSINFDIFC